MCETTKAESLPMPVSRRLRIDLGKTWRRCDAIPIHHTRSVVPEVCMSLLVVRIVTMAFVYRRTLLEVAVCLALFGLDDGNMPGLLCNSSLDWPGSVCLACAFAQGHAEWP